VVLCIEQYKNLQNVYPFLIGIFASITAIIIVPSDKMLVTSICIALVLLFTFKQKVQNELS